MQVSDLILRELVKRGHSRKGGSRVWDIADSKLWYLTPEQSQAYLDLEKSIEYNKAVNQKQSENLMEENAKLILENLEVDSINVIDLGCGDGKKAANLVRLFKGNVKIRYCPIDISGYMVGKAIETFSKMNVDEILEFQYNISDFENLENITPLLTKGPFKRNLFLLLGNTLGNFEITDLLYQIRNAMKDGDLLLVDTAVADKDIRKKTEMQSKNMHVHNFLKHIPLLMGLSEKDIEYKARFENSRIEFYYNILKGKEVKSPNRKIEFKKGDEIIVAIAYKHNLDELRTYFNIYFDEARFAFSKDSSQAFVLCKK